MFEVPWGERGENILFLEAETIPVFHPVLSSAVAMLSFTTASCSSEMHSAVPRLSDHTWNTQTADRQKLQWVADSGPSSQASS